jgi:hypothetical protein
MRDVERIFDLTILDYDNSCKAKVTSQAAIVTGASGRIGNLSLPPKRGPASLHRWYNEILLMRLSGAHYGVRSVNDNEYSYRQRD